MKKKEKQEDFKYSLIGETAGLGKLEPGIRYDWLGEHIWLLLIGPKLEVGTKMREVSVINQVLDILS